MERKKTPPTRQREKRNWKTAYIGAASAILIAVSTWCIEISRNDASQNARLDAYSSGENKSSEEIHQINDKVTDIQKNIVALTVQMKYKQDKNK